MDQRAEKLLAFAEEKGVSKPLATKILNALYAKGLSADDFGMALYRLEEMIEDEKLNDLINSATDEDVAKVVDLLAVQKDYENGAWCSEEAARQKIWLFSELAQAFQEGKEFKAGDTVEIQIMRTGHWDHPIYGEVEVTKKTIRDIKRNFDENKRGIELCVDENHDPDHKALGWFRELRVEKGGEALFAVIELNNAGAQSLTRGDYRYFSPELVFKKVDEESGDVIENMLLGGAFTNRPFFKDMVPLMASEDATVRPHGQNKDLFLFFTDSPHMKKFLELVAKMTGNQAITAAEVEALETAFAEIQQPSDAEKTILANIKAAFSEGQKKPEKKEDKQNGVVLKANEVVVNATEFAAVKLAAEQGTEALRQLNEAKVDSLVSAVTFSEANKAGKFHDSQKDAVKAFLTSLSDEQRSAFAELVGAMPKIDLSEKGTTKAGEVATSVQDKVNKGISEKFAEMKKANPAAQYGEAAKQFFAENAELHKLYTEEMIGVAEEE